MCLNIYQFIYYNCIKYIFTNTHKHWLVFGFLVQINCNFFVRYPIPMLNLPDQTDLNIASFIQYLNYYLNKKFNNVISIYYMELKSIKYLLDTIKIF